MTRFLGLFTLLLSLFITTTNTAQTVTIGTEAKLGNDYKASLPINPYYGFTYSQTIYLADDIDATGNITAIQYHFNGASLANSRQLKSTWGLRVFRLLERVLLVEIGFIRPSLPSFSTVLSTA